MEKEINDLLFFQFNADSKKQQLHNVLRFLTKIFKQNSRFLKVKLSDSIRQKNL